MSTAQVVRYTPYGAARELFYNRDLEVCLDGPAGTGKTLAALNKVHLALLKYPGSAWLIARKTNVDLTASALVTYQQRVLHEGDHVEYFGGNRVKPAQFTYPNGSVLMMNGIDKSEKVKSTEFDGVYLNEATELEEEDIEIVRSRLRNGCMPYSQIILDCNPGAPTHWLNQRMLSGKTTRLVSVHQDNPRYYDRELDDWTDEGRVYVDTVLGGLTGVRHARLALGQWVSAEGLVYEEWDRATHLVNAFEIPRAWPRFIVLDFGFTNPFVAQWYALDKDGRAWLYREYVQTKRTVDEHAREVLRLSRDEPAPRLVIADPEDADGRAVFSRVTHWGTISAHKDIENGVQAMRARLRIAGDKKPRLLVFKTALTHRDSALALAKKPIGLAEEIESYIWDTRNNRNTGEMPMPGDDHSLDTARYMCAHLDLARNGVSYAPSLY